MLSFEVEDGNDVAEPDEPLQYEVLPISTTVTSLAAGAALWFSFFFTVVFRFPYQSWQRDLAFLLGDLPSDLCISG